MVEIEGPLPDRTAKDQNIRIHLDNGQKDKQNTTSANSGSRKSSTSKSKNKNKNKKQPSDSEPSFRRRFLIWSGSIGTA
ncbi:MAG TPA: hypothetical protein VF960_00230, partial [Chloroflexota bacterium]